MDFPNYALVNASPVNNGPGTIYQTTVATSNGQPTDLFTSGMQYSSKNSTPESFFQDHSFFSAVVAPAIDSATGLQLQPGTAYTTLPAQYPIYGSDSNLFPFTNDNSHSKCISLTRKRRFVKSNIPSEILCSPWK